MSERDLANWAGCGGWGDMSNQQTAIEMTE